MVKSDIIKLWEWKVVNQLHEYSRSIGKTPGQACTELLGEALDNIERAKHRAEHEYELKKTQDEIKDLKSRHAAPYYDEEQDELDAELADIIRLAGIDNVYHGEARRLVEELSRTDAEVLRRYAISFVQANAKNGQLLDRIARALEAISREVTRYAR